MLLAMEYEDIFLTQDTADWEEMDNDLDISKYIKEQDDFIMWRLEERLGAQGNQLLGKMYEQEFQRLSNRIFHLKDNEFVKHNGDVIEYITCTPCTGRMLLSALKIFPLTPQQVSGSSNLPTSCL